jgi:hypothetical protein
MPAVRIEYNAPPTLSAFLDSSAFVRVVEGPVGSGKSSACVLEILRRAREQQPGPDGIRHTRFAVVRNTYRELNDTTRKTFEQWVPDVLGKWNEQDFTFHMRFADVDCEVLFRALDKPADVKKLLSLELTGVYFNEVREIAKPIFDGAQGRVGRYPSKKDGGATWFGVWADTNPWHTGHWLHKLRKACPEGFAFFQQPGGLSPDAENRENLPPGYYDRLCAGKDQAWIDVYVKGLEASSDVGSIFGKQLDGLESRGGICAFEHAADEVFTHWDLGRADATAIWFWRLNQHGTADIIDFYAAHGEPLSHYFEVVDAKPYRYAKHVLPHDAKQKTLATQLSTLEQCQAHWGRSNVVLGPPLSVEDGISAARWLLEQPGTRIHTRCDVPIPNDAGGEEHPSGLEALREYRYEWDDEGACFRKSPLHNWASHPADAFRYVGTYVRFADLMTRRPPAKPEAPAVQAKANTITVVLEGLDDLSAPVRRRI